MSKTFLITKDVYDKDLSEGVRNPSQNICGMTSKTWETQKAFPEITVSSDLSSECNMMLIEPLMMYKKVNPETEKDRSEVFNDNISLMKENRAVKLGWTEEQELLRWNGCQRKEFLSLCKVLLVCNQYLYRQLSVYAKQTTTPMSILRTPIDDAFYMPKEKERKVVAMGRICAAKNIEGVIEVFKNLPDDIEKVYIGNQSMWGVAPNNSNTLLEKKLQDVVDRWIPLASRYEVASELSTALGYFNVSVYDVGCLSFLESAMSGCHCFAWTFHPMFDEYTQCHRFNGYKDGANLIKDVFDKSDGKWDAEMRNQVYDLHSYGAFRSQLNDIILQIMVGSGDKDKEVG